MMQNTTDIQFVKIQGNSASLPTLESSDSKRTSMEIDTEPESHNSSAVWKNNSFSAPNIKVTPAYFGGEQFYNSYFEEFTTHDPIDFDSNIISYILSITSSRFERI